MNVLGLRISRRVLLLALIAFLAYSFLRRNRGRAFPNWTVRQRAEP